MLLRHPTQMGRGRTSEAQVSYYPEPYRGYYPQVLGAPPHRSSTAHLVCAWVAAVITLGYMLPWAIGATRNRPNCVAIALINFFLGWSLIGWIAALILACSADSPAAVVVTHIQPGPYRPYGPAAQPGYGQAGPPPALPAPPPGPVAYGPSATEPTQDFDDFYRRPTDPR